MKYANTAEEKKQLSAALEQFEFQKPEEVNDNPLIVISGEQGTHKTHLACTMSNEMPTYLLDTEHRGHIVARKFPKNLFYKQVSNYNDVIVATHAIFRTATTPSTIIIDSGSDFQQYAETRYKDVAKLEKIWPQYLWAMIWDMCDKPLYDIRSSGHTLILTTRVKDEYINDKPTGKKVPRIYNRIPYAADIMLEMTGDEKNPIAVTKNGYFADHTSKFTKELTLPEIIKQVKTIEIPKTNKLQTPEK